MIMSLRTPYRKPPADVKYNYKKLISREFRDLQLAKDLQSKSIFDLIDYCEILYEKLVESLDSEAALRAYVRGYLIFNYFINCFIMVHFHGFDKFIESNEPDFILYLNVFAFYHTNDVIRDNSNSLPLEQLRRWIIEYLTDQKLLSFDVEELYDWLYKYIDYLKQKDLEVLDDETSRLEPIDEGVVPYITNDTRSIDLFEKKYPSVDDSDQAMLDGSFDFLPIQARPEKSPSTPYPINDVVKSTSSLPYPLDNVSQASTEELYFGNESKNSSQTSFRQKRPPVPTVPPVQLETSYDPRPYSHHLVQPKTQNNDVHSGAQHQHSNGTLYRQQNSRPPMNNVPQSYATLNQEVRRYTICGLKNFGSTCYINLTLQLLFGLPEFAAIFDNRGYLRYLKDPKYLKLIKSRQTSRDSGLLSEAIFSLLKSFKDHPQASIAPTKFLRVSSFLKPDLNIPYEQQDSQEFLLFILEMLHSELGSKVLSDGDWENEQILKYMNKWGINVNAQDRDPFIAWYKSLLKLEGYSPIHDLFQGHLQSKLICNQCGHESSNFSPFTILSLPIPASRGGRVDLADCLRYYTKDEILTGENAWKCPKCTKETNGSGSSVLDNHAVFATKKNGLFRLGRRSKSPSKKTLNGVQSTSSTASISTTKKLNFVKLPKILLMHLSRFSMTNVTDKLDIVIKYPLQITFNNGSNNVNHQITYKLTAIINHYGTLKSGHYTALVNKCEDKGHQSLLNPCWCYFDDDQVRVGVRHGDGYDPLGDYRELNSRDVYVLCYEQV